MTVAELEELRDELLVAYRAALTGKSYTINSAGGSGRSYTRQDLLVLRQELDRVNTEIDRANGDITKTIYVRPMDP